jgi:hypothetical protein
MLTPYGKMWEKNPSGNPSIVNGIVHLKWNSPFKTVQYCICKLTIV